MHFLYGLKSSDALFCNHLADCMMHMGYTPCFDDPYLWMKPMIHPDDKELYYAYILCYVDEILSISHDAESLLKRLDKYSKLNPSYLKYPYIYLGANLKRIQLKNGLWAWSVSPSRYMHQSVKNVEKYIVENLGEIWKFPSSAYNPFTIGYSPDIDEYPELDSFLASYYQSHIGILRWMVELGRVEINT